MRFNYHKEFGKSNYRNAAPSEKDEIEQLMQLSAPDRKKAMGCLMSVAIAISLPIILIGIFIIKSGFRRIDELNIKKQQCTQRVNSIVEEIKTEKIKEEDSDGYSHENTYYRPVLKYEFQGREYHKNGMRYSTRHYNIGDLIETYVDPADPEHVYIPVFEEKSSSSPKAIFFGGSIFLILGLLIPISSFIAYKRKGLI